MKLRLTGEWKKLDFALNAARFKHHIRAKIDRGLYRGADFFCTKLKTEFIKNPKYGPLSSLTAFIKGSELPLFDLGEMSKSIHAVKVSWDHYEIGISSKAKRPDRTGKGSMLVDIARILHEGSKQIIVTKKMKRMFDALYWASLGKEVKLVGRAKYLYGRRRKGWQKFEAASFRIPKRPFIEDATKDAGIYMKIKNIIEDSIDDIFGQITRI